jgi:hypothetical protein
MKQKRYNSSFEIDVEIFALRRKANEAMAIAAQLEQQSRDFAARAQDVKTPDCERGYWANESNYAKSQSEKLAGQSRSITENKIPRLVRTKGAMLTKTFDFVEDNGITLQQ